jgi:uncharacterized surface protein with fasciclin (FAS1) repeats
MMKKSILTVIAVLAIGFFSNRAFAQAAATAPKGDLLDTLSASPDYNVSAVLIRAAGLTATVRGAGPYTIFAPSNIAFSNIPSAKLDALMKDPAALAVILKGHIVSGKYGKAEIIKTLGSGTPTLTTIDGKVLTLSVTDKHLTITDSDGNKAKVVAFDMLGTNGVAIGVDAILAK